MPLFRNKRGRGGFATPAVLVMIVFFIVLVAAIAGLAAGAWA